MSILRKILFWGLLGLALGVAQSLWEKAPNRTSTRPADHVIAGTSLV